MQRTALPNLSVVWTMLQGRDEVLVNPAVGDLKTFF